MANGTVRVALTDHVQLARIAIVRKQLGDRCASRTAGRLIDAQLDALGIERLPKAATDFIVPAKPAQKARRSA